MLKNVKKLLYLYRNLDLPQNPTNSSLAQVPPVYKIELKSVILTDNLLTADRQTNTHLWEPSVLGRSLPNNTESYETAFPEITWMNNRVPSCSLWHSAPCPETKMQALFPFVWMYSLEKTNICHILSLQMLCSRVAFVSPWTWIIWNETCPFYSAVRRC